jgi:hypothetical protein
VPLAFADSGRLPQLVKSRLSSPNRFAMAGRGRAVAAGGQLSWKATDPDAEVRLTSSFEAADVPWQGGEQDDCWQVAALQQNRISVTALSARLTWPAVGRSAK